MGHENRRVGGDDELRIMLHQIVHPRKHGELPLRREGRFRFVKNMKAFADEAIE
jgi:hypothetical protein